MEPSKLGAAIIYSLIFIEHLETNEIYNKTKVRIIKQVTYADEKSVYG